MSILISKFSNLISANHLDYSEVLIIMFIFSFDFFKCSLLIALINATTFSSHKKLINKKIYASKKVKK
jgi:hypothetical protein